MVQRAEVMASLFYLLAVWLVLIAVERRRTRAGAAAYLGRWWPPWPGSTRGDGGDHPRVVVLLALVTDRGAARTSRRPWLVRLGLSAPFALLALGRHPHHPHARGEQPRRFDIPALAREATF